jgi:hypothetical protein
MSKNKRQSKTIEQRCNHWYWVPAPLDPSYYEVCQRCHLGRHKVSAKTQPVTKGEPIPTPNVPSQGSLFED